MGRANISNVGYLGMREHILPVNEQELCGAQLDQVVRESEEELAKIFGRNYHQAVKDRKVIFWKNRETGVVAMKFMASDFFG
jgi:hypothetical protein